MQNTLPGVLMPGKQWGGNVIKLGVGGMWVLQAYSCKIRWSNHSCRLAITASGLLHA